MNQTLQGTIVVGIAFAATAHCVRDHHFDALFDAYLDDEQVRQFLADHNPAALAEMSARLLEAQDRELWRSRRNDTRDLLQQLIADTAKAAS